MDEMDVEFVLVYKENQQKFTTISDATLSHNAGGEARERERWKRWMKEMKEEKKRFFLVHYFVYLKPAQWGHSTENPPKMILLFYKMNTNHFTVSHSFAGNVYGLN